MHPFLPLCRMPMIVVAPHLLAYVSRPAQAEYDHLLHDWGPHMLCICICNALYTPLCVGALTTTLATGTVAHLKVRQRQGSWQGQGRKPGRRLGLGQGHSQQLGLGRGQGRTGPEGGGQKHRRTVPERQGWGRQAGLRPDRRPERGLHRTEERFEAQLPGESLQNCLGCSLSRPLLVFRMFSGNNVWIVQSSSATLACYSLCLRANMVGTALPSITATPDLEGRGQYVKGNACPEPKCCHCVFC